MQPATETAAPAPLSACARCGTFAPLSDNGWRALCASCAQLARHPLEGTAPAFSALVIATVRAWSDLWRVAVPLGLAVAVPHALIDWLVKPPAWFGFAWGVVISSFAEAFLLAFAVERFFGGRGGVALALARARRRYFAVAGVNLITNVLTLVGLITLVLAPFVAGVMCAAVPIALFEQAHPVSAVLASWRRSRGHRVTLFLVGTLAIVPPLALTFAPVAVLVLVRAVRPGLGPLAWDATRVVAMVLTGVFTPLPQLLQVAAWQATRPRA